MYIKNVEVEQKPAPTKLPDTNVKIRLNPQSKVIERRSLRLKRLYRPHRKTRNLFSRRQGIWTHSLPRYRKDPTKSATPGHLLRSIYRQDPLAQNFVVSQINEAFSSPHCSTIFTTEHKSPGSSSKSSLKPGDRKSPAPLITGRSYGGPDWILRPE